MSQRHKHPPLARPAYGAYHRHEWALLGAPCGLIQELAATLVAALGHHHLGYLDADHAAGDAAASLPPPGARLVYTDKINHHRLDWQGHWNEFVRRPQLAGLDAVLVNGNHFAAQRQVVVLDPRKAESLQRKQDRLTGVDLVLTTPEQPEPYPWLADHLATQHPTFLPLADTAALAAWLDAQLAPPPLYGLVLAGGHSTRMGLDKGLLNYRGKPQREYAADLLAEVCTHTFISCRADQVADIAPPYAALPDSFLDLGPYGAILSAFRAYPNVAWLVAACDLPLLDGATLGQLVGGRAPGHLATAFHNAATGFPDPLLTIWEPRAYFSLLQFLAQGHSCPRKVLINSDIAVLQPAQPEALHNANTPEEREAVARKLEAAAHPSPPH